MKVAPESFQGTSSQLRQYQSQVSEVAKATNRSSVSVIEGTTKALQTGIKNMDEALQVSKQSAIYSNVSDIDQGEADRYIAGVMSSYGGMTNSLKPLRTQLQGASKDYSRLNDFIDQSNYVGNNFAMTSADVGEILMQSSSALSTMGVSMQENIAKLMAIVLSI